MREIEERGRDSVMHPLVSRFGPLSSVDSQIPASDYQSSRTETVLSALLFVCVVGILERLRRSALAGRRNANFVVYGIRLTLMNTVDDR